MDYAKMSTEALARIVYIGERSIDELPNSRRHGVQEALKALEAKEEAVLKEAEKKAKKGKSDGKTK